MVLSWLALVLLGMFVLFAGMLKLKLEKKTHDVLLKFQTEVQQPINPNLLPKALTVNDLNTLARQFCQRGQAMIVQCIERHITNPYALLSPFCRSVVNQVQAGHDLTTDVQYLWGYLPNSVGTLKVLYTYPTTTWLTDYTDLKPYVRGLWRNQIPPQYQTYFWTLSVQDYYYHKPEDKQNPTPCAYTGVIVPPTP
jgi:hypothetical protein